MKIQKLFLVLVLFSLTALFFVASDSLGAICLKNSPDCQPKADTSYLGIKNTAGGILIVRSDDCEKITPGVEGEICIQDSATCPIAVSTSTAVGGFACLAVTTP